VKRSGKGGIWAFQKPEGYEAQKKSGGRKDRSGRLLELIARWWAGEVIDWDFGGRKTGLKIGGENFLGV